MNQINSIYTTLSGGQVHIAADTKYIGSIASYSNCFFKFFAWLFGRSMSVNFDGTIRTVNKKSYTDLIRSLTSVDKINEISQYTLFRPIAEKGSLPNTSLKMRDVITRSDRLELFEALGTAISNGDTTTALLMIGKGAELDRPYFDRQAPFGAAFCRETEDLTRNHKYCFTVFKAPPILQAARKANLVVCKFLQEAGANLSCKGYGYLFEREITNVSTRSHMELQPIIVPHAYQGKDKQGKDVILTRPWLTAYPVLKEETVVDIKDTRSNVKSYQLSAEGFELIEEAPVY